MGKFSNINNQKKPVLIIAWRRPNQVKKVICSLREYYSPNKVYVACDGPLQSEQEKEKVLNTRKVIEKEIDWDCEIKKLYSPVNKGCRKGVSDAISWFFSENDDGIILEDDCVPDRVFYYFCEKLLDKYKNNKKIISISGNNFQDENLIGDGSFYLSRYTHIWGWATWKDRWNLYDLKLLNWPEFKKSKKFRNLFQTSRERNYWAKIFDKLYYYDKPNTWDYQWLFTSFYYDLNTIIPNTPLVENIGFDPDSTHIFSDNEIKKQISNSKKLNLVKMLKEPNHFERSIEADNYAFKNHYKKNFIKRIMNKLPNFFR